MNIAQANALGIKRLRDSHGASASKQEKLLEFYELVRQPWFRYKAGIKSKKASTKLQYTEEFKTFAKQLISNPKYKTWFSSYMELKKFLNEFPPKKTVMRADDAQKRQREGFDFDRQVASQLKSQGFLDVYTTAGSRSSFDVVAIPRKSGKTVFAQCKRNRRLELKDVKQLVKFLSKAPAWAEVRLYYVLDGKMAYSTIRNENDLKWFATISQKKRDEFGLKQPKIYDVLASYETTASVDVKSLMKRVAWTGLVSGFASFYDEVSKLWPKIVQARYNLAKTPSVDKLFTKLYRKYEANFGVQKYIVFKFLRLKEYEPKVRSVNHTRAFHRESSSRTENQAFKQMQSGASFICKTDRTEQEIAHVIRVRGDRLELAFCRANGLLNHVEHEKLKVYLKSLPSYVNIRFYFYINAKKTQYKDLRKNLEWFTTQRGVDLNHTAL